ncbi:hypothetical protein [uncultured Draconibacterium sp.]|uniref:hypothetical protein n=1 Tax=uncultured Draconibacterium sp. TaxID=1573823 RepID=UPI003216721E
MKHLTLILTMFFVLSCTTQKSRDLSNDNLITMTFSATEINDLVIIQDFFDNCIGLAENEKQDNIDKVYFDFFQQNSDITKATDLKIPIDFEKQKGLYNQIDKKTFEDIWSIDRFIKRDSNDTLKNVGLNRHGKYFEFLKLLGGQDSTINKYYNTLEVAGDISPSMVADLAINHEKYDIKDPKVRLVIAIHYLTLNDKFERKEKY